MNNARDLLALLSHHEPIDSAETAALTRMRAFVTSTPAPFTRENLEGHVTGSAMVLDPNGRALLLFHARLALWVQPGGHVEPTDASVAAAAFREAREESGLDDLVLATNATGEPQLLDVDVHPIPENTRRGEPAHWHHDLCFVARTLSPSSARIDPDESHALRWISKDDLESITVDPATRRRLLKAFALPKIVSVQRVAGRTAPDPGVSARTPD